MWAWLVWFFLVTLVIPWPAKPQVGTVILVLRIIILASLFFIQIGLFPGHAVR